MSAVDPFPSASLPSVPRTHLGLALFATILCFLPLGVIGLYYGLRVDRAVAEGRLEDAAHDSRVGRGWILSAIVVGVLVYLLLGAALLLLGAFSS